MLFFKKTKREEGANSLLEIDLLNDAELNKITQAFIQLISSLCVDYGGNAFWSTTFLDSFLSIALPEREFTKTTWLDHEICQPNRIDVPTWGKKRKPSYPKSLRHYDNDELINSIRSGRGELNDETAAIRKQIIDTLNSIDPNQIKAEMNMFGSNSDLVLVSKKEWLYKQKFVLNYSLRFVVGEMFSRSVYSRVNNDLFIHDLNISVDFIHDASLFCEYLLNKRKDIVTRICEFAIGESVIDTWSEHVRLINNKRDLFISKERVYDPEYFTQEYHEFYSGEYKFSDDGLAPLTKPEQLYGLAMSVCKTMPMTIALIAKRPPPDRYKSFTLESLYNKYRIEYNRNSGEMSLLRFFPKESNIKNEKPKDKLEEW